MSPMIWPRSSHISYFFPQPSPPPALTFLLSISTCVQSCRKPRSHLPQDFALPFPLPSALPLVPTPIFPFRC